LKVLLGATAVSGLTLYIGAVVAYRAIDRIIDAAFTGTSS
jgi:hypothetical protein